MGRFASIDYGLVRIGVAVSDERKIIASSIGTVAAEKTTLLTVKKIAKELSKYELETIVVGLPLHLNGKRGFLADEVMHFVSLLKQEVTCEVVTWDERLSTAEAERMLREANMSRKKRSKVIDGVAATLLLQNYLDAKMIANESLH